ncbi:MAG: aryl-sulfate sulfotransferase [Cellulosilyticaceae bacterium]
MNEYLEQQKIVKQTITNQYKTQKYTLIEPLIIEDPFGVAPLTAMVLFRQEGCSHYTILLEDQQWKCQAEAADQVLHIVGLRPGRDNLVTVQGWNADQVVLENTIKITPLPLPEPYKALEVKVLVQEAKAPDYMALNLAATKGRAPRHNLCSVIDPQGDVRWYYTQRGWNLFKQLRNGHIMMDAPACIPGKVRYIPTGFVEMNLLGEVIRYYEVPNGLHHDVHEMPSGNFLVLTDGENSIEDIILEVDRQTGEVVRRYDFKQILDPTRQPGIDKEVVNAPLDWLHLNSVFYDETDDTLIVSSRNQNCVVKIGHLDKQIRWILGPHEHWTPQFAKYLLSPQGEEFEWSWAQHSAFVNEKGQLMLFDNGNFRSYDLESAKLAYQNYSRGVTYQIDEKEMVVRQIWQYGKQRQSALKCPYLGSISVQSNGNPFMCFGGITKDRFGNPIDDLLTPLLKASAHLIEIDHKTNQVVFEMVMRDTNKMTEDGFVCYRAEKINLYQ